MSDNIVDEVKQIQQDVSLILLLLRGSEDTGPGIISQARENRAAIQKLLDDRVSDIHRIDELEEVGDEVNRLSGVDRRRTAGRAIRLRLAALSLVVTPVIGYVYHTILISDIRHIVGIDPWVAVLGATALQAAYALTLYVGVQGITDG